MAGIGLVALVAAGCGRIPTDPGADGSARRSAVGAEDCDYAPSGSASKVVDPPPSTGVPKTGSVTFRLTMTEGDVAITMSRLKAPCTVNSFESLARQKYFDKTRCHRLIDVGAFILQCGDPTGTGTGGPGYTFADETDQTESYTAGVVAMANSGANTNGSQFFLVYDDSSSMDDLWRGHYTIFGQLDEKSRGIVARMAAEGDDGSEPPNAGKPNNPCEIIGVTKRS